MAPEVLNENEKYNYKADFWSFALCCWELLYGHNNFPFSLESKKALLTDIKHHSGKQLRFPNHPKFPDEVKDFFIRCLHVSPQLRIDSDDFFNHPFFSIDEPSEGNKDDNGHEDEQNQAKPTGENDKGLLFSEIKKSYNEKILEIRLCKNIAKDTFQYYDPKGNKEFESNLLVVAVTISQKAKQKTETCLFSLEEKKNVYNLNGFQEFIGIPNEYLKFKTEVLQLQEEIKALDNEVYETFTSNCFSQEFRERVNDVLFRSSTPEAKKALMQDVIKYVQNNHKGCISEYDMTTFPLNLKRIIYIMKGKILENLKEFV